jgi:hypothetical protein
MKLPYLKGRGRQTGDVKEKKITEKRSQARCLVEYGNKRVDSCVRREKVKVKFRDKKSLIARSLRVKRVRR